MKWPMKSGRCGMEPMGFLKNKGKGRETPLGWMTKEELREALKAPGGDPLWRQSLEEAYKKLLCRPIPWEAVERFAKEYRSGIKEGKKRA